MFSGEKMFQNVYMPAQGDGMIAFASSFRALSRAFQIHKENEMIFQKSAFLASERWGEWSFPVYLNKKLAQVYLEGKDLSSSRKSAGTA